MNPNAPVRLQACMQTYLFTRFRRIAALAFALCLLQPWGVLAAPVKTPHVEAELIAASSGFVPGEPIEAALRLRIIDHWHTYWRNPGDSGLPTKLNWNLPSGFSAGDIAWPYPKRLPLGPLMNFGYEGEVLHLVRIDTPTSWKGGAATLRAKADWLVCSDVCIPESADVSLTLPVSTASTVRESIDRRAIEAARAKLPQRHRSGGAADLAGDTMHISLKSSAEGEVFFFPYADDLIANAAAQPLTRQPGGISLRVALQEGGRRPDGVVEGVLFAAGGFDGNAKVNAVEVSLPVQSLAQGAQGGRRAGTSGLSSPGSASTMGLGMALLFALLGGLILNLMPCVFPVLGIKLMSFVRSSGADAAKLRTQGLAFMAGVLVSFWVLAGALLALKAGGSAVGWGFQLQSPLFVSCLAALFTLLALNLVGVFEVGASLQNLGNDSNVTGGATGAFMTGVLATVVATPCTAPFMGAAMGYTLAQPAWVALLVFTAVALGMALPMVVLAFKPAWISKLPRPGAWMETLKQFLAFPLLATVAWLVWVLGSQQGNDAVAKLLFALVVLSLGAWAYGRWQTRKPVIGWVTAAIALAVAVWLAWPDEPVSAPTTAGVPQGDQRDNGWEAFSPQRVEALRAQNKPVFIDFTASWCITCQVNKRVALTRPEVERQFELHGVTRMRADWSRQDQVITAALAHFGRNGVPLYVFYPAHGEPRVLPEVLTPGIVIDALSSAAGGGR